MSRWVAAYLATVGILAATVVAASVVLFIDSGPDDPGESAAQEHGYDIVGWELRHLPQKWLYKIGAPFRGSSDLSDEEALQRYFSLGETVQRLQRDDAGSDEMSEATEERAELENRIEDIIEGRITAVLEDQGLALEPPIFSDLGIVFPPVDFELDSPPRILAVSPRDRIELDDSFLLTPGLGVETAIEIEADVESENQGVEGLSARVLTSSGVATYPSVLSEFDSYPGMIDTAFHEWVHQYLIFFPLGRSYFSGADVRTINETVASISGRELARIYFQRYPTIEAGDNGDTAARDPDFDFFAEMRQLREDVEEMLGDGKIEEAETLMDAKRDEFERNGFFVREINQAYFAFRGFYATGSGSIDPLGPNLQAVFEQSGSAGDFLRLISGVTTRSEVEELIAG
ncbi:MAG: hypothetical protein IH957_10685 [Chloroflexi bacterium]|nr:hypothetical protein [Chloroflexota bacterium]